MNNRVCFVGDSHVAALRLGLGLAGGERYRDHVDIFGARGKGLKSISVERDVISSDDTVVKESFEFTGGASSIELEKYDAVCVVGCFAGQKAVQAIVKDYATSTMMLADTIPVSRRLFEAMLASLVEKSLAYDVVRRISLVSAKPLYYMENPLYSIDILSHPQGSLLKAVLDAGAMEEIQASYLLARERTMGKMAKIILQPPSTVKERFFTESAFSQGSSRLSPRAPLHKADDFNHMNGQYGVLALDAFFTAFADSTER